MRGLLLVCIAAGLHLLTAPAAAQVYVRSEAVWLQQEQETFLFGTINGDPIVPADSHYAPGFRVTAGAAVGCDAAVEFSYMGTNHWDDQVNVTIDGPIVSGFSASGHSDPNVLTSLDRTSRIHSLELDYRADICSDNFLGKFTTLAGARYLSFNEEFDLYTLSTIGEDTHHVATTNDIFALQAGLERRVRYKRLALDMIGTAGFGFNSLSGTLNYADLAHGVDPFAVTDDHELAFVTFVDLRVGLSYWLTEWMAMRVGYDGIVTNGLALTSDLLDRNRADLDGGVSYSFLTAPYQGSMILHGGWIGFEIRR